MIDRAVAHDIKQHILAAGHVLIVPHSNPRPDGDCLGAALALAEWCTQLRVPRSVFCTWDAPDNLRYLPHVEQIIHDPMLIEQTPFDLVLVVDFGRLANSGLEPQLRSARERGVPFINIDHHPNNNDFGGEVCIVREQASATCELVYELFQQLDVVISPTMATNLLTGIMTDTQNFTNLATTPPALLAGADLVRAGAIPHRITAHTWQDKEVPTLQLWGKMLLRLHQNPDGIIVTAITTADLVEAGLDIAAPRDVANFLNQVDLTDAKAIMVLREEGDQVKGSLRTTREDVDVTEIARQYGGGGHRKAAGFSVAGHISWDSHQGWVIVRE